MPLVRHLGRQPSGARVTRAALLRELAREIEEAERYGSTAPVAAVLRDVAARVGDLNQVPAPRTPAKMLTVAEAALRLNVENRWFYDNADRHPWIKRLGRRTMRIDERGLERFLESA